MVDVPRDGRPRLVVRQHGVTLVRPFGLALALTAGGATALVAGWPWTPFGALGPAVAAAIAFRAAWRWERTRVVFTEDRLLVVEGTLRRRTVAAGLGGGVTVDQSLAGRMLGYGTLVAGELDVPYVPDPDAALRLVR